MRVARGEEVQLRNVGWESSAGGTCTRACPRAWINLPVGALHLCMCMHASTRASRSWPSISCGMRDICNNHARMSFTHQVHSHTLIVIGLMHGSIY